MEAKQDDTGFWYYPAAPEDFRRATIFDFKRKIIGMPYLIHSFHYDIFECHRVNNNFKIDNIIEWLNQGRIYVKK